MQQQKQNIVIVLRTLINASSIIQKLQALRTVLLEPQTGISSLPNILGNISVHQWNHMNMFPATDRSSRGMGNCRASDVYTFRPNGQTLWSAIFERWVYWASRALCVGRGLAEFEFSGAHGWDHSKTKPLRPTQAQMLG